MSQVPSKRIDFDRALAETIAELRRDSGLSQGNVADELGLDQAAISRTEAGQRGISVAELFTWFDVLGVEPDQRGVILNRLWSECAGRPSSFWGQK